MFKAVVRAASSTEIKVYSDLKSHQTTIEIPVQYRKYQDRRGTEIQVEILSNTLQTFSVLGNWMDELPYSGV